MHNLPFHISLNVSQDKFNLIVLILGIVVIILILLARRKKHYNNYRYDNSYNYNSKYEQYKRYQKYKREYQGDNYYYYQYNNSGNTNNKENSKEKKENNKNKNENQNNTNNSVDPFKILESNRDDDFLTIKKNYIRLIKEFHPDKIKGLGLHEDFIAFATYKTQLINKAFDEIKKYYNK